MATLGLAVFLLVVFFGGIASAASRAEERQELRNMADVALRDLYRYQPGAQEVIRKSAGYAVFSNVGLKILVAGTGTGKGIAIDNKTGQETFMKVLELQAGLGIGVKRYRLVWVFENQAAYQDFITKGRQLGGQASLSAKVDGKGGGFDGAASVDTGVWLYQLTDKGLAAEITLKASKYYRDKDLN